MNAAEFLQQQGRLRSKLLRAVPRSERARKLEAELARLARAELERELREARQAPPAGAVELASANDDRREEQRQQRLFWWDR